ALPLHRAPCGWGTPRPHGRFGVGSGISRGWRALAGPGARRATPGHDWDTGPMSDPRLVHLDYWCELQCPDCHSALDDIRALRDRYGTALAIDLRHFPLERHKYAFVAAQAAEEAWAQGMLWPFVEAVLENTGDLATRGEPVLLEAAADLGLDVA